MEPRYIAIKSALLDDIEQGKLVPGKQVPSENQLAERFGVSRMTARRALSELVNEGILARSQGIGTFVSDARPMSSVLNIVSIDKEIRARGHRHHIELCECSEVSANEEQANWLGVSVGTSVYRLEAVHYENGLAVQLEQRWVNPAWAPDFLAQSFHSVTANQYLSQVAPLTEADNVIEAILPTHREADLLAIELNQPCMRISRRTYSVRGIVSYAVLLHPGNRYRLGGHLQFSAPNKEDTL